MAPAAVHRVNRLLYRRVLRHAGLPTGTERPYVVPGMAARLQRTWDARIAAAPVLPGAEHGARAGVGEIEEVLGCPLCGEDRVQPLLEPSGGGARQPWRYRVVRCPGCGLLYRNPGVRPERLGDLYAKDYSRFLTGGYATARTRRYRLSMDALAPLLDDGAGRRLLDFGCGAGLFLELAHARGFATYGIDLSPDSVAEARRRPSGAHAHAGEVEDVPELAAGGFDVVTLWSVLAHLPRPVDTLARLRGLLAPGGVLLIMTVNANSLLLKRDGPRWTGFTRNHLVFSDPRTLPLLLRRAGFGDVVVRPSYGDEIEAGTADLAAPLQRRLRRTVEAGNQGNMLRAAAFAEPGGAAAWGMTRTPPDGAP